MVVKRNGSMSGGTLQLVPGDVNTKADVCLPGRDRLALATLFLIDLFDEKGHRPNDSRPPDQTGLASIRDEVR